MRATARRTAIVLALLLIATPLAAASHWTLYHAGIDRSVGRTSEDDGEVARDPGNPLAGRANRVTYPGSVPGDGTLFLDARMGIAAYQTGPHVYTSDAFAAAFGEPDMLPPGQFQTSAWYGWWLDSDQDGEIDDIHDAQAAGADEFRWRGQASREAVSMHIYTMIANVTSFNGNDPARTFDSTIALINNQRNETVLGRNAIEDHTALERPEQTWEGGGAGRLLGSFLTSYDVVVLAGARPAIGSRLGYDFDDPAALVDVDRYEAVSSDVETLYRATVPAARALVVNSLTTVSRGFNDTFRSLAGDPFADPLNHPAIGIVLNTTLALVWPHVEPHWDIYLTALDTALLLQDAPLPREPNHPDDDYEGRALYGGVGDIQGSYNRNDGYVDGPRLWADTIATTQACAGAYVPVPGTPISESAGTCTSHRNVDAFGPLNAGRRSTGHVLYLRSVVVLWHDVNRDGYLGKRCDTASPQYDAETGVCFGPHAGWGQDQSDENEVIEACEGARGRGTTFTIAPEHGSWPPAVVMRDWSETTRLALGSAWEVPQGNETVVMRWNDECGHASDLTPRDGLFFPLGGTDVPLRVTTRVSLAGYLDAERGIDIGEEYVLDIDVLPASL